MEKRVPPSKLRPLVLLLEWVVIWPCLQYFLGVAEGEIGPVVEGGPGQQYWAAHSTQPSRASVS